MSNAVQKIEDKPQTVSETTAIVQMIERAASNPSVDIDKMERLLQMQERVFERRAKSEFSIALAAMQPTLPTVERNGRITITDKNDRKVVIQSTPYALWEDINEAIRPCLAKHGFAMSFRTGQSADGKITVTAVLSHSGGHQEETTITLQHDSTGSKNSVQAVGSSISYGKRYTAGLLLNITSRGEDDDGKRGGNTGISAEQVDELQTKIISAGADVQRFLQFFKIERVEDLPSTRFADAMNRLNEKSRRSNG